MGKKVLRLFLETMLRALVIILAIGIVIMGALLIKTLVKNPRALSDKRFSRPPRYDHFDISPSSCLSLLLTGDLYILALLFFYVNTFFQIISFFCDWYFQVLLYPCFCRNSCPIHISSGVVIFIFV